jgi:hypothetical protein
MSQFAIAADFQLSRRRALVCCAHLLLVVAILLNQTGSVFAQGTLDQIRGSVRTPDEPKPSYPSQSDANEERRRRSDGHNYHDDDDDSAWLALGALAAGAVVAAPFYLPQLVVDDPGGTAAEFLYCPYADGHEGFMAFEEFPVEGPVYSNGFGGRIGVDYGDQLDDVRWIGGELLFETRSRWGVDVGWKAYEEATNGGTDRLWVGDANVTFRFAQSPRSQWRAGVGLNWLDDSTATDYGFNFTYGADFFPVDPLVATAQLDWGTLGEDERLHLRTTLGVTRCGWEAYIGYDYEKIGAVDLHGPVAGLRFWY